MNGRVVALVAIVVGSLIAYPLVTLADGAPRFPSAEECIRPAIAGESVDVVYGRFDDPVSAAAHRDKVVSAGFTGTEALTDGCGRWKVVYRDVADLAIAVEVQGEARTVGLDSTLERGTDG